jgi:hypothetical protein
MSALLAHRRYLLEVDRYEQMVEAGIFTPDDKIELIEGELVNKMPIGRRHAARVKRTSRFFNLRFSDLALVSVQNLVRLDTSEPESDIALLRLRDDFYESGHPTPADIHHRGSRFNRPQ